MPTDLEAHGQRSGGCKKRAGVPISALLKSRDDSASAGARLRGRSSTRETRSHPYTQVGHLTRMMAWMIRPKRRRERENQSGQALKSNTSTHSARRERAVVLVRPADHAQHVKVCSGRHVGTNSSPSSSWRAMRTSRWA